MYTVKAQSPLTCNHAAVEEGGEVVVKVEDSGHGPERQVVERPGRHQPPTRSKHPLTVPCIDKRTRYTK